MLEAILQAMSAHPGDTPVDEIFIGFVVIMFVLVAGFGVGSKR